MNTTTKRLLGIVLAVFMLLAIPQRAMADPQEVKTSITNFRIENSRHETVNSIYYTDAFYLAMDWETDPDTIVHAGDYFTVDLPDEMKFAADSFDLKDGDVVIAKAQVNPGPDGRGGNVVVTFTENADSKYNVHGDMYVSANFVEQYITLNEPNTFSIEVGSEVIPISVTPTGPQEIVNEHLFKWGYQNPDSDYEANWTVRINHAKSDLKDVVITDTLGEQEAEYIPGSFRLSVAEYNSTGSNYTIIEDIDLSDKLTISEDGKSFTINLGDTNGRQYRLSYRTTYLPGMQLRNNVTLTSGNDSWIKGYTFISQQSGGSGTGELANKIKIIKVDEDDNTIVLAGAVFEVTRPNGTTFILETDANGEAVSDVLIAGEYQVKEIEAPTGYILDDQVHTLTVTNGQGTTERITNKSNTTNVTVRKTWVGTALDNVTVHLLANGDDTGKTVELSEGNSWTATFDNLQKVDDDGNAIVYTVVEDPYPGYTTEVSGSTEDGFTVTNTQKLIDISGSKTWDDNGDQDGIRPESITIRLLADGVEVESRTVGEADDWSWSFTDLPEYDENGEKIPYTVTEDAVPGYTASYDGYNVTNAYTPETVDVEGAKTWDDDGDRDGIRPESITIRLLADGVELESKTVTAADGWSWSFTDLPKYEKGEAIAYTVTEDAVPGYTASYDGYNVTNAHTPSTTRVSVAKAWVDGDDADGKRPASVTIRLLANGEDAGRTVELSDENGWVATFDGLPEFEGGRKIAYTVEEVPVEGYASKVAGDAASGFVVTNTRETTPPPPAPPAVPKAGDAASAAGAWAAALLGGAAVSLLLWRRTRGEL